MLTFVRYQFAYTKKQWLGCIPSILAASFVTGICLFGFFNVIGVKSDTIQGSIDPTPIFIMPLVFGGVTLFLTLSGVIKLLIEGFRKDYVLWAIIGADPKQLALLIGGQLFIMSVFVSILGGLLSFLSSNSIYQGLQALVGTKMLPPINITFSPMAFLSTVVLISCLSGLSGVCHGYKVFKRTQKDVLNLSQSKQVEVSLLKKVLLLFLFLIWITFIAVIFVKLPEIKGVPKGLLEVQLLFFLMIIQVIFINVLAEMILPCIIKALTFGWVNRSSGWVVTAKWKVIESPIYLKSIVIPLVIGITLVSGFSAVSNNVLRFYQENSSLEFVVTFILYLASPIILICANVLSITLVTSNQESTNLRQMYTLGFSPVTVIAEKIMEASFYIATVSIMSLIMNYIVVQLSLKVASVFGTEKFASWESLYIWVVIISIISLILLIIIKVNSVIKFLIQDRL